MGTRLMGRAFGVAPLEWTTGSLGLRPGLTEESRYVRPPSLHASALIIAMASPFVATLFVLALGILRA